VFTQANEFRVKGKPHNKAVGSILTKSPSEDEAVTLTINIPEAQIGNILGKNGNITVKWKSIIFPAQNTAQIRISVETTSSIGNVVQKDKIILMSFTFDQTSEMTEEDRLLNPLGFIVTMYKIEDENPNI
jgi:type IV secretory pathway component VirB8